MLSIYINALKYLYTVTIVFRRILTVDGHETIAMLLSKPTEILYLNNYVFAILYYIFTTIYFVGPPRPYHGSPPQVSGSPGSCPKPCSPSLGCQSCVARQPPMTIYDHPFHSMLRHPYFAGKTISSYQFI